MTRSPINRPDTKPRRAERLVRAAVGMALVQAGGPGPTGGSAARDHSGGGITTLAETRREALVEAAKAVGEDRALRRIVEELESRSPEVARDLGW